MSKLVTSLNLDTGIDRINSSGSLDVSDKLLIKKRVGVNTYQDMYVTASFLRDKLINGFDADPFEVAPPEKLSYTRYTNVVEELELAPGSYSIKICGAGGGASYFPGGYISYWASASGGSGACIIGKFTIRQVTRFQVVVGAPGRLSSSTGGSGGDSSFVGGIVNIIAGGGTGGGSGYPGSKCYGGSGGIVKSNVGLYENNSYVGKNGLSSILGWSTKYPESAQPSPATSSFSYGLGMGLEESSYGSPTPIDENISGAIEILEL